jgi:predicted dinucleotide-binding enzyme
MNIAKVLSIALIAGAGACGSALAQSPAPPDAVMLVPGVYTTPEISAKCQAYAAKRVVGGSNTDSSRQAVALACAQKLWKQELVKMKK